MTGSTTNITEGTNLYYTDARSRSAISSTATGLTYTSGTGAFSLTAGYSIPTTASQTNWDSAYTQRLQWDGGSTNLVAATARTSLGLVIGTNVQAWNADLDAIAALAGTSGLLKKTAANTWSLDTATYLTANQSITLSGDISGSGSTAITTTLATVVATKGGTGQTTYTTGDTLYSSAANTLAKLAGNTTTTKQFLSQTGTGTVSAAPAWSTVSKSDVGLSSVENTALSTWAGSSNVTTLGTIGTGTWSGTNIALNKGGTNAALTAAAGGVVYSTASAMAITAAGTAGQLLQSNGTSAPSWVASPGVPTGSLFPYAGSSAPTGYLLCDGSSVSSTNYLALHAVISNTYGGSAYTGGSGLNYNLPDLRGRFPMGSGTGSGLNASGTGAPSGTAQTARTRGQWGGEETHLLSTSEMPSHNHNGATQGAGSHYHTFGKPALSYVSPNGNTTVSVPSGTMHRFSDSDGTNDTDTAANHTHTIDSQGGGSRHNIIPPFVVLNYIIKT